MSISQPEPRVSPPRFIATLAAGFNTVANHIYLVFFPIVIDLFLWFGPMARISNIFSRIFEQSLASITGNGTPETIEMIRQSQALWVEILTQFNLFSLLRAFPIGIPSLLAFQGAIKNPLGSIPIFDIDNGNIALSFAGASSLLGVAAGAIFFSLVARAISTKRKQTNQYLMASHITHSIQLALMLLALIVLVIIPLLCGTSFLLLLLPQLGAIPLLLIGMLLLWVAVPLIFTPHGIFSANMNPVESMRFSFKLVRQFLPGTSTFILLAILISYGLNYLWLTPQPDNWLLSIGILGHAFITTGILAATFIYYERGVDWMNEVNRLRSEQQKPPAES